MNILETITARKKIQVAEKKELVPVALLERSPFFDTPVVSLEHYLLREDMSGIIAEFKKKSPSKGDINPYARVEEISIGYMQAGASALSILTDEDFFGGSSDDLTKARKLNYCPILRKDFIIDPYQVIEAKSMGADAILLIAAVLTPKQVADLAGLAKSLGLEILLEIHSEEEIGHDHRDVTLIGVNSRNLSDFSVDLHHSVTMMGKLSGNKPVVAESGIGHPADVVMLREAGFQGFLIGELFMRTGDPATACREFIKKLKQL